MYVYIYKYIYEQIQKSNQISLYPTHPAKIKNVLYCDIFTYVYNIIKYKEVLCNVEVSDCFL